MTHHAPALASHGVRIDPAELARVGWTLGTFDDAVTLRQLGYQDGADCEPWEGGQGRGVRVEMN